MPALVALALVTSCEPAPDLRRGAPSCDYHPVVVCDARACAVEPRFRCVGRRR